ncbi:MAG TPA: transglycosylase SLT domain-containing protein [Bryobacteraceae bacterium]|nr:transglycosylase SLT domain-containing protein [Bryobacteraceae bacterium]
MDGRTKTVCSFFLGVAVIVATGCGYGEQSKFQTSFLPPTPHPVTLAAAEFVAPPIVQPNLYLQDSPPFLNINPQLPVRRSRADGLVQQAEQRFQRGRRSYRVKDMAEARRDFDAAVDLMLEASDQNPSESEEYAERLDQMVDTIHRFDLAGLGASADVEKPEFEKAPLEDILPMTFPIDPKLTGKVQAQVAATVSQLPLTVNDAVLSYINYFSNRGRKTIIAGMERSGRYRPMIQRVLDEEGVPQELIHLAQAESGFIPRAVSRKAAGGMWQFLSWRGQEYGLMRTKYTDDRMDPEKATHAAAHHLRDLYQEFGDWYLAIAAYNCGPGVVEKAVERTGYADFWELRNRGVLPAETTNYVPIILAMTIIEKNAAEYGLDDVQLDPPVEYDTVEVSSTTSLNLVSDITDTPVAELLNLNPALLTSVVPDGYSLKVPKGSGNQLLAALQLIPAEHRDSWRLHRVSAGETLASIGKRYGTNASRIIAVNNLQENEAVEGDRLLIPAALKVAAPVRHKASKTTSSRRVASHRRSRKPVTKSARSTQKSPVILARSTSR